MAKKKKVTSTEGEAEIQKDGKGRGEVRKGQSVRQGGWTKRETSRELCNNRAG